jgi:hypothetical protein
MQTRGTLKESSYCVFLDIEFPKYKIFLSVNISVIFAPTAYGVLQGWLGREALILATRDRGENCIQFTESR